MGSVHIGVGQNNDLVITRLFDLELFANSGSHRLDQRDHFGVLKHPSRLGSLYVEDFASDRQNRHRARIASLDSGPAGGVSLNDEQF